MGITWGSHGDHMGIRVYGDHSAWGLQYTMNELVEKTQLVRHANYFPPFNIKSLIEPLGLE